MCLYNISNNCIEFILLGLINRIIIVNTGNRKIGWNLNNVHTVNITELLLLCQCSTGHTGLLLIFIKEVLECDRSERLTLTLHLHMLLRLNCLMQTIRETTSRHNTSGKLIDD